MIEAPAFVPPAPRKLNWLIRLGLWLEGQRPARLYEQRSFEREIRDRLAAQDKRISAADFMQLVKRVNELELYVGLKRDFRAPENPLAKEAKIR